MTKLQSHPWRPEDYLDTFEDQITFLQVTLEDGDPLLVQAALGAIARAQGMTKLAKEIDVGRESLYKSLSVSRNTSFATIFKAIHALGFDLKAVPLQEHPDGDSSQEFTPEEESIPATSHIPASTPSPAASTPSA
jgi:probable addiction module antidote protein